MPEHLIFDLTPDKLASQLKAWGQPSFREKQIWQGLYQQLYTAPEHFSTLPKSLVQKLSEEYSFSGLIPIDAITSGDGQTEKILFELFDGRTIESVLMHYRDRDTVCVSTQVGCAVGCVF